MIEEFLINSTWPDLIRYLVIAIVLTAMSPFGIFTIRYFFSMLTGSPRPYIIQRRPSASKAIADLEETAAARLQEMAEYISILQVDMEEVSHERDLLRSEVEALKFHIRSLDGKSDDWTSARDEEAADETDFKILGLKEKPTPTWDEIRAAFRSAAKIHHPDRGGDEEIFKKASSAYERLATLYGMT